jgi:predicted peptidase
MTLSHGLLLLTGAALLLATGASADDAKQEEQKPRVIPFLERWEACVHTNESGETLPYRLLKPKAYDPGQTYPLVVVLHGMGERGSDNASQLVNGVSELFASDAAMDRFPAVVIAPQCPDGEDMNEASWSNWRDETPAITGPTRLVLEIVKAVRKQFTIDSDRMYIGGLSMGGFGTWDVIQEYPDLFAAAFPICGGGDPHRAERIAQLPLWVFHGATDETVPPQLSRDMVRAIQEAGGHPGYTEYPDVGHDSWTSAFEEPRLLAWLFSQKRKQSGATGDATE